MIGAHLHPLSDYERRMKSKGRYEIAGLKLPFWKGAIDDLESDRQPVGGGKRRSGIKAFAGERLFQTKNNLRFYLQRTTMCK